MTDSPIPKLIQAQLEFAAERYAAENGRNVFLDYKFYRFNAAAFNRLDGKIPFVKNIKADSKAHSSLSSSALGLKQAKFLAYIILDGYSVTYGGIKFTTECFIGEKKIQGEEFEVPVIWDDMFECHRAEFLYKHYSHIFLAIGWASFYDIVRFKFSERKQ
jgi:hypothetical protein